jgi:5-methylcytosine-specific restriction protein A
MPTAPRVFRPAHWRPHVERPRTYDDRRGNSAQRGYGSKWRKARATHLEGEPLCRHCMARGKTTAATEVDHITPHRGDWSLFWDRLNWQSLCKACHSRKTAKENGGYGNRSRDKY